MKLANPLQYVWEAVYLILVAVVVAYSWIGHRLDILSPLPVAMPVTIVTAPVCGALVYLFTMKLRRSFYATIIMCLIACVINVLFMLLPGYKGIGSFAYNFWQALRMTVIMAIYVFPFAVGGSFVASYLYPE